ncbi:NUDIX hydrolase [Micromonospora sp. NPDC023888]|uniref:NUDIX hydrolase n=1 Tax=Micromonospora sp. NPDC023888 TaxID=3155607 RepID=UPI0033C7DFA5
MVDTSGAGNRRPRGRDARGQLNTAFRAAIAEDWKRLNHGQEKRRPGRFVPYDGGWLTWSQLAELISQELTVIDPENLWDGTAIDELLHRDNRRLPQDTIERQNLLEGVQRVLNRCFDTAAPSRRRAVLGQPHDYVAEFLGGPPLPPRYRDFDFDPASVGFFRISNWNKAHFLDRARARDVQTFHHTGSGQDWVDQALLDRYLDEESADNRGSSCTSLVGYEEDTREAQSQNFVLKVAYSEYYQHVAIRRLLRDHPAAYDLVSTRIRREGLRQMISRSPRSNIAMNVTITARSGRVLLIRRPDGARVWPGFFQVGPHETMNWPSAGGPQETCFDLGVRALWEEAGLGPDDYEGLVISWFGFYAVEASGYFFAHVRSRLGESEITERIRRAESAFETEDVEWVDVNRSFIQDVLRGWAAGPWRPRETAGGHFFLPHSTVSLLELYRVRRERMFEVAEHP